MQSIKEHSILKSTAVVAFCTFLSRITGFIRDIFLAEALGAGMIADALFAAFKLPNVFRRTFGEGALSNAFVPIFSEEMKNSGKKSALQFAGAVTIFLSIALFVLTLIIELNIDNVIKLINPGFLIDNEKMQLTIKLSAIMFPYIILISFSAFLGAILNSIGIFWYFAISSVILNIGFISCSLLFKQNVTYYMSIGVIISGIIQVFFVFYGCLRYKMIPNVFIPKFDDKLKKMWKNFFPALISSSIFQINILIDTIFASFFAGAIAYLHYADKITQLPLSMIGYSISIAILPAFSLAFLENNKEKIQKMQNLIMELTLFLVLPCTISIFFMADEIIKFIYERGNFLSQDTKIVANMLKIFVLSLPFNVLGKILSSISFAKKNVSIPLKINIISLILNIVFNLILIKLIGKYSIVVATTSASIISTIIMIYILIKNDMLVFSKKVIIFSIKIFIISIFAGILMKIGYKIIEFLPLIGIIGAGFYLIICILMKLIDINILLDVLKSKLKK